MLAVYATAPTVSASCGIVRAIAGTPVEGGCLSAAHPKGQYLRTCACSFARTLDRGRRRPGGPVATTLGRFAIMDDFVAAPPGRLRVFIAARPAAAAPRGDRR
jgi:hypothetical protein